MDITRDLLIETPPIAKIRGQELHQVTFTQLKELKDPVPNLRLYCTSAYRQHNLQIRGTVSLNTEKAKNNTPRHLIATISLSLEQLEQIADYVTRMKAAEADMHYDENRTEGE